MKEKKRDHARYQGVKIYLMFLKEKVDNKVLGSSLDSMSSFLRKG